MNLSAISNLTNSIMRNRKTIAKVLFFAGAILEGIPSLIDDPKPAPKRRKPTKKAAAQTASPKS